MPDQHPGTRIRKQVRTHDAAAAIAIATGTKTSCCAGPGDHVGCIAGVLSIGEYRDGPAAAGFTGIEISPTHQLADGIHSAIIRAVNPGRSQPMQS
jgi:hypothetical protein